MKTVLRVLLAGAIATTAFYAYAQVRADARPSMTPIASSSSNGVSFAWFYDSPGRTVVVCRIGPNPADNVDCKAKATLP